MKPKSLAPVSSLVDEYIDNLEQVQASIKSRATRAILSDQIETLKIAKQDLQSSPDHTSATLSLESRINGAKLRLGDSATIAILQEVQDAINTTKEEVEIATQS